MEGLAGVEHQVVEDGLVGLVIAHAGQHDAAGLGLAPDVLALLGRPVCVVAQREVVLLDLDAVCRAVRHAAVARAALDVVGERALVERVDAPPALLHASAALVTLVVVDLDQKLRLKKARRHRLSHLDNLAGILDAGDSATHFTG
jgi:hypothetical protein